MRKVPELKKTAIGWEKLLKKQVLFWYLKNQYLLIIFFCGQTEIVLRSRNISVLQMLAPLSRRHLRKPNKPRSARFSANLIIICLKTVSTPTLKNPGKFYFFIHKLTNFVFKSFLCQCLIFQCFWFDFYTGPCRTSITCVTGLKFQLFWFLLCK